MDSTSGNYPRDIKCEDSWHYNVNDHDTGSTPTAASPLNRVSRDFVYNYNAGYSDMKCEYPWLADEQGKNSRLTEGQYHTNGVDCLRGTQPSLLPMGSTAAGPSDKPYKCYNCQAIFCEDTDLRAHMLMHTAEKPFQCNVCGECFSNIFSLKKHVFSHQYEDDGDQNRGNDDDDDADSADVKKDYDVFSSQDHLKLEATDPYLQKVLKEVAGVDLFASEAGKSPRYSSEQREENSGENNSDTSMREENLQSCSVSSDILSRRDYVDGRPYACLVCDKSFKYRHHLKEHSTIHTGEKPFGCHVCDKRFGRSGSLNRHLLKVHNEALPAKEMVEKDEGDSSSNKMNENSMELSQLTENSFEEERQSKMETSSDSLNVRPYRCEICDKSFKFRHHMKEHVRLHSGEKTFMCDICGKSFARSGTRNRHLLTHSKKDSLGTDQDTTSQMENKEDAKTDNVLEMQDSNIDIKDIIENIVQPIIVQPHVNDNEETVKNENVEGLKRMDKFVDPYVNYDQQRLRTGNWIDSVQSYT